MTRKKTRVEHIILSGILPVMKGRGATYRNCKRMAINTLVEQMYEEEGVVFVRILCLERRHVYERWPPSKRKGAAVFSENLLRSMDSGTSYNYLN